MMNKPVWLDEQPAIVALLNRLIDQLDKQPFERRRHAPAVTVNQKQIPELFVLGEQADQTWALIKALAQEFNVLSIRVDKKRNPLDPEYLNARVRLQQDAESAVRHWLARPREPSPLQRWREAVEQAQYDFPGDTQKLSARPITLADKSAAQIVQAFTQIASYQHTPLSLRQLSAKCFWGRSKFLDGRRDLVHSLYPELQLSLRPIVVNVFVPGSINGVLFIENQDSYTSAMNGCPEGTENLALVYSAGFKSSAKRIREHGGVALHFCGPGLSSHQDTFEQWWYQAAVQDWPLWFWGDLDFAGMNILKLLRQRFPGLSAWRPGYAAMLDALHAGNAHHAGSDDKQNQIDPGPTGCDYADSVLLPAIREHKLFVDQEIVF
jgi:hypothetical protein